MSEQQPDQNTWRSVNPIVILREAIQAVPSMKYALAVLGLVAVVAIVTLWQVKYQVAVLGAVIILVFMVTILVFAKLTNVAPRHFLGPARCLMWGCVLLGIVTASSLFTAVAFKKPQALYELISSKSMFRTPGQTGVLNSPQFITQIVLSTNEIKRTEFITEPIRLPGERIDEFLTVSRIAYGTADATNKVFAVDLAIKNIGLEPLLLDLDEKYFSMEDDKGRRGELIHFCCPTKGDVLPPDEERGLELFFRDPGWHGKGVEANWLFIRVRGFLPVVRASWRTPPLVTAD